jgi:tripartite-type tricarboxylate transporter receptor subunit TctC
MRRVPPPALLALAAGLLAVSLPGAAPAQTYGPVGSYPVKPVRLIVASSAGSNPDVLARIVAAGLAPVLGQQVIVENRAGAGGNIGAEAAARAPADGYTLFVIHTNHAINTALHSRRTYDLFTDFAPITQLASSAFVLAVHPSLPARSVRELIALAQARPGEITYASAGSGSATHLAAELFNGMVKVKMLHVAYNGGGPALAAIVAGETSVYFAPISTGMPHLRANRLRPLGVTTPARLPDLPGVPAIAGTVRGYTFTSWAGLMAPVQAPRQVVDIVHKAAVAALKDPGTGKRLAAAGFVRIGNRPDDLAAVIQSEVDRFAKLIRAIGLRPE